MDEYINKKALLDELCLDNCERTYDGTCHNCRMTETIADFPAADVAEVRHGKWQKFSTASGIVLRVRCSVCAGTHPLTFESMPYCPACGARMGKEE